MFSTRERKSALERIEKEAHSLKRTCLIVPRGKVSVAYPLFIFQVHGVPSRSPPLILTACVLVVIESSQHSLASLLVSGTADTADRQDRLPLNDVLINNKSLELSL